MLSLLKYLIRSPAVELRFRGEVESFIKTISHMRMMPTSELSHEIRGIYYEIGVEIPLALVEGELPWLKLRWKLLELLPFESQCHYYWAYRTWNTIKEETASRTMLFLVPNITSYFRHVRLNRSNVYEPAKRLDKYAGHMGESEYLHNTDESFKRLDKDAWCMRETARLYNIDNEDEEWQEELSLLKHLTEYEERLNLPHGRLVLPPIRGHTSKQASLSIPAGFAQAMGEAVHDGRFASEDAPMLPSLDSIWNVP
ncbi:hypothetical protein GGR54DRAFT_406881 [Hypoxylon sp. NC1633]|nr:hypothetical protein GGR54DRAFT_406881 [Hypoxylon sp. NC1633]